MVASTADEKAGLTVVMKVESLVASMADETAALKDAMKADTTAEQKVEKKVA